MRRDRRGAGRLLIAATASAGLHLAVLAVLVTSTKPPPAPDPGRPVEVTLFRPVPVERPPEEVAPPESPPASAVSAEQERQAAEAPIQPRRPVLTRPSEVGVLPVAPGTAPAPLSRPASPSVPVVQPPSPARPGPRPPSGIGEALQAADCDERARRLNRPGCDERLGSSVRTAPPLGPDPNARLQAEAAARTAAVARKEAARLRPGPLGGCPSCGGMSVVGPEGPPTNLSDNGVKIPFGKVPPAITPIPPSTLRGDDDALRPKPPRP